MDKIVEDILYFAKLSAKSYEMLQYSDDVVGMSLLSWALKLNKIELSFMITFEKLVYINYGDVEDSTNLLWSISTTSQYNDDKEKWLIKSIPSSPERWEITEVIICGMAIYFVTLFRNRNRGERAFGLSTKVTGWSILQPF